jgi:hypothetical protein
VQVTELPVRHRPGNLKFPRLSLVLVLHWQARPPNPAAHSVTGRLGAGAAAATTVTVAAAGAAGVDCHGHGPTVTTVHWQLDSEVRASEPQLWQ